MHRTRDWKKYLTVSSRNAIRAICETNNAPLGKKLRFAGAINRLADADEPEDFDDRNVLTQDGYATTEDLMWSASDDDGDPKGDEADPDVEGDEDGYDVDGEPRSSRWRFASLSFRDQDLMIARFKTHLCQKIGVSQNDWEPSNALILDAIEGDFSEAVLIQLAYADYLATPRVPDLNPSDEDVALPASDDLIRVSYQSSEKMGMRRHLSDDHHPRSNSRRGPRKMVYRRRNSSDVNSESHTPKYGRQDWRHQLPRLEAKFERRLADQEAILLDWRYGYPEYEQEKPTYLSAKEQIFTNARAEHMGEWVFDLAMEKFERECDDRYHGRNPDHVNNRFSHPRLFKGGNLGDQDSGDYDDYYMFTHLDDDASWDWPELEDEQSPFPDSWFDEDRYDDIFADYGNTDQEVDARHIRYSSRLRFTGRYRPTRRMVRSITRHLA